MRLKEEKEKRERETRSAPPTSFLPLCFEIKSTRTSTTPSEQRTPTTVLFWRESHRGRDQVERREPRRTDSREQESMGIDDRWPSKNKKNLTLRCPPPSARSPSETRVRPARRSRPRGRTVVVGGGDGGCLRSAERERRRKA